MDNNLDQYYKEYSDKVFHYLRSKIRNEDDVQDLHSAIFVKVCQHVNVYSEEKSSISTWIYTIAHNSVIDFYRGKKRNSELNEGMAVPDTTDTDLLNNETLSLLADVLKRLSLQERQIVIFHYYQGFTLKEVADKIEMSYSNCKLLHTKALMKIRTFMQV